MNFEDRVKAVAEFGFTERQAGFLVTVMLHSGVCVPRQYASFAGTAYGHNVTTFFDKLGQREYVTVCDCLHNRAALYHVKHHGLYRAIGQPHSRYRRPVAARQVFDRLMQLDGLPSPRPGASSSRMSCRPRSSTKTSAVDAASSVVPPCLRRPTTCAQTGEQTGRRFVPPLTAVPIAIRAEPWRERPRVARSALVPRLFWGRSRHGSRCPSGVVGVGMWRAVLSVQNAAQMGCRIVGYIMVRTAGTSLVDVRLEHRRTGG